jgi:type II secretory pathway component PulF
MPSFRYQSLSTSGQTRNGVVEAMDRAAAVRMLLTRGETATILEPLEGELAAPKHNGHAAAARPAAATPAARRFTLALGQSTVTRAEMASFVRELATAIEAGLPLMSALRTVRRQAAKKAMVEMLDHLISRVEAGATLHQAAREHGAPFDEMMIGMLRAADATGEMAGVLHQLADLLDRSLELRREVIGALFYPIIVALLLTVSVIILVTVLVPKLIAPLAGQIRLPWPTEVVLGLASFLTSSWIYCIIGVALLILGWRTWTAVPSNRLRLDRTKLRLPLVGRVLRDVAVARFTRTLGTLVSAGLPILDALRITSGTLGNKALQGAVDQVQEQVTSGKSLADPLERSGLFPPLLVQVVSLGEKSGRLEKMLMHAATAFDRQVNNSIRLFTKSLQPVLLVVMASAAGFILAAILLPLLELQSMVK